MTDDTLRAAAVAVCRLWFTDNAPCDSQHVRKAMLELREAVDALAASAPDEGLDLEAAGFSPGCGPYDHPLTCACPFVARPAAPAALDDGTLDAIRAYGDARADVAYGRATRKAIDHAWETLLTVSGTPPMDRRPAEEPTDGQDRP